MSQSKWVIWTQKLKEDLVTGESAKKATMTYCSEESVRVAGVNKYVYREL